MTVATTLDSYLSNKACQYDMLEHPFSETIAEAGMSSSIPLKRVAKAVVLHDYNHYMVAAIPAMNRLMLPQIDRIIGSHAELATENELQALFGDCDKGAIPAIGQAYGLNVIWDDALKEEEDIYIEAGDHRHLIHLKRNAFLQLMQNNPHGEISCAPDELYDMSHIRPM
ncbi:MAG: YbaK/EbsC family protein [Oceanospirillales bacterium]|nr:YbaK/EbsC family protein [Oceanospirillales bacterium]MBR9887140.1 YbaK/EbsC family protein [Oceanospirillales bacterium]